MRVEDMITDVGKKSWNIFKKDFVTLIIGTVIALVGMIFVITIPPLIFGIYHMCIQLVQGKKVEVTDVFKGFSYFLRSWGIFILAFLAVMVGLVFLVIPGLILMVLFQYVVAVAIFEDRGVIESLKRSFEIGKKYFTFSIVLWIFVAVLSSIGGVTRIGVLLTLPFTTLMLCIATKKLTAKTK